MKEMKERIQKVIASTGKYSRRQAEALIDEGLVKVNGVVLKSQGVKVNPFEDRIWVNGKNLFFQKINEPLIALLLNKPRHVMVTKSDEKQRMTVYELLPKKFKDLKIAGRLDYLSQGALVITNSGELIQKLTHPTNGLDKVYRVKISGEVSAKQIEKMSQSIIIDGHKTKPAEVKIVKSHQSSTIVEFLLHEGRNRQVRRLCESVGLVVKELKRISIGPLHLSKLKSGQFRPITSAEIEKIINFKSVRAAKEGGYKSKPKVR